MSPSNHINQSNGIISYKIHGGNPKLMEKGTMPQSNALRRFLGWAIPSQCHYKCNWFYILKIITYLPFGFGNATLKYQNIENLEENIIKQKSKKLSNTMKIYQNL